MVDAILRNQALLFLPRILYLLIIAKSLLPVSTYLTLSAFFGTSSSMDEFKGRYSQKTEWSTEMLLILAKLKGSFCQKKGKSGHRTKSCSTFSEWKFQEPKVKVETGFVQMKTGKVWKSKTFLESIESGKWSNYLPQKKSGFSQPDFHIKKIPSESF